MGIKPGEKVLDVASGPGAFSILAAQAGADVLSVDFSLGMVEYLRDRARCLGVEGLCAEVMDGQDLKLEDGSFDFAYSSFGIILFRDRAAGMREFCRVLKPGGLGVIVAFTGPKGSGVQRLMMGALKVVNPDFEPAWPSPISTLENPDDFRSEMLDAGFTRVNMFTVSTVRRFDSPESLWRQIAEVSPVWREIMKDMIRGQKKTFGDAFVRRVRNEQGDGPYGVGQEARIAVGVK
jgi:ubiquinone/menaquinone biosynthesis C-methylase UbiE